jgi:hypothetical protein
MANPNIVSVSEIKGESIGEALTTTVTTDIMTIASNKLVKVNFISVANTDPTTACDVTVSVVKTGDITLTGVAGGEDNAGTFELCSTVSCPADDVLIVLDKPIYLMETDVLEGGANPATADIFISYEVIDDA